VQAKFVASKGACLAAVTTALRNHPTQQLLQQWGPKFVTSLNAM
jgi:hypothetical protein